MPESIDLPSGCFGVHPSQVHNATGAGVDIRPGSWDVIIADICMSPLNIHVVRPVFIGKVRDEVDVLYVLRQYHARSVVADARPEATLAKRLQEVARKYGIQVWRSEYNTAPSIIPMQANEVEGVLKLDRTTALDEVHYAFQTGLSVIIPQNFREITGGNFHREMCASTRVPTKWMGKECYDWVHQGHDHSFHAFGYLMAAIKKGNLIAFGGNETLGVTRGLVTGSSMPTNRVTGINWDEEEEREQQIIWEA